MTEREQRAPSSQTDSSGTDRDWRMKQYSPSDREGVFQLRTVVYGESFPEDDWVWKFGNGSFWSGLWFIRRLQTRIPVRSIIRGWSS